MSTTSPLSRCATVVLGDSVDRYMNAFIRDIGQDEGRPVPHNSSGAGFRALSGPSPGATLDGRYKLVELLGYGGMGAVWRARDLHLGRTVALKTASLPNDAERRRFVREARICSRIRHRNIVEIYDARSIAEETAYYTMELVEGRDLSTILEEESLGISVLVMILQQVAAALYRVHEAGVVHRDVKPGNVVIDESASSSDGVRCKLVDFGLAAELWSGHESGSDFERDYISMSGQFMGTPQYMSPEQIQGAALDHKSDIYGFGCLAYEVLTGAPPFVAESMHDVLQMHLYTQPEPIPAVALDRLPVTAGVELEAIVMRCLAKRVDERPASMLEVRRVLGALETFERRGGDGGGHPPVSEGCKACAPSESSAQWEQ
ncbi:MAG: serine/threonine-protein kinase [Myxococcota bacterium]